MYKKTIKVFPALVAVCIVAALCVSFMPDEAFAITASGGTVTEAQRIVSGEALTGPQNVLAAATKMINNVSVSGLTSTFDTLLGTSFSTVQNIFGTVSQGIGYTVLVIVYLIQLIKIATHMEGNATLPGVKEVLFLVIFIVVFKHLVDCALQYAQMLYDGFNSLTIAIGRGNVATSGGSYVLTNQIVTQDQMFAIIDEEENGELVSYAEAVIVWICALCLQLATFFSVLARSLQAYILAIFSPIPLAFLGLDDTRSWGVSYIKNFLAVCLAGAVIMVLLIMIPPILQAAVGSSSPMVALISSCLVAVFAMFKAGGWAKDILGG